MTYATAPFAYAGHGIDSCVCTDPAQVIFLSQTADEEGTGELDIDTFKAKMAPHLGEDISDTDLVQLFMKIDADCGGTVDWQAFLACCEHLQNFAINACQYAAVTKLIAGLIDDMGFLLCHREEFTNYFFLRGTDVADQQEWKFFPQVSTCCRCPE